MRKKFNNLLSFLKDSELFHILNNPNNFHDFIVQNTLTTLKEREVIFNSRKPTNSLIPEIPQRLFATKKGNQLIIERTKEGLQNDINSILCILISFYIIIGITGFLIVNKLTGYQFLYLFLFSGVIILPAYFSYEKIKELNGIKKSGDTTVIDLDNRKCYKNGKIIEDLDNLKYLVYEINPGNSLYGDYDSNSHSFTLQLKFKKNISFTIDESDNRVELFQLGNKIAMLTDKKLNVDRFTDHYI